MNWEPTFILRRVLVLTKHQTRKAYIGVVLVIALLYSAPTQAAEYKNFDLPDQAKVKIPEGGFSYQSQRAKIQARKIKEEKPSYSLQEFLFVKEAFLTEKREEAIKLLRQELDSGVKRNRDNVLLKLGQLYVEKYMELSYRENQNYNEEYKKFESQKADPKAKGKASGKAPVLNNNRSRFYLQKALSSFYQLEKEYPKHPKIDEVFYFIGFVEMESKNTAKGEKYLERVVKDFPQSAKYDDAAIYLADSYFDRNKFKESEKVYLLLVKRNSNLKDYARYKLAWVALNTGGPQKAVNEMKQLILSLGASPDTGKLSLKDQALKDLLVFYAETGEVDDALSFFTKTQGKSQALENLKALAEAYRSKALDRSAIRAYSILIETFEDAPEAPKWYLGIYDCESRLGKSKGGVEKLLELLTKFNEKSSWAKNFPKERQNEKNELLELISSEAEKAAFFHHQAGQRSSDKGHYQAAIKLYSSLLENFPEIPSKKKILFFRGEALYNQGQWMEASDSYLKAAELSPKDKLSEESLYNALLSIEHLTQKTKNIKKYSKEEAKKVDTEPKDLSVPEKRFIEVALIYEKEYPTSPKTPDVLFRVGTIYYQKNQFEKANEVFTRLVKEQPGHRTAPTAAHLILDMYNIRKDYLGLTRQAEVFFAQKNLGDNNFKAEMKKIMGEVDFKMIEPLEKENKWEAAGQAYFQFYQKNPKSELAEQSLFNAFVSYEKADKQDKKSEMARVLVAKFPNSAYTPKALLTLAKDSEKNNDFERAERFYLEYAQKYPKETEARKALYNAAVFSDLLEKNQQALRLYDEYLKPGGVSKEERNAILESKAALYQRLKDWKNVDKTYRELMATENKSEDKLRLLAELGGLYERNGLKAERDKIRDEIRSKINPKMKTNLGLASLFAAEADFLKIAPERKKYQSIKLRFPPDVFISRLKQKERALAKLATQYDSIVEYGVPEWGVAALFEKGEAYQELVSEFNLLKIPKNYKAEERAEIEEALKTIQEKNIKPIEKTGNEIWESCAKRAQEFKVVNRYAENCREKSGEGKKMVSIFPKIGFWSGSSSKLKEKELEDQRFFLATQAREQRKNELSKYFLNLLQKDKESEEKSLVTNDLAMFALGEKNRLKAIALFEKAVREKPDHPSPRLNLGGLYIEGWGFQDALPLFEKAFELSPKSEDAALGLGVSLEGTGQYERARKHYESYLSSQPEAEAVLFNYAIILGNHLKDPVKASQVMLRYIQRGGKLSSRAHEIIKTWR